MSIHTIHESQTIACLFNEVVTSSRNFAFDVANALCGISNVDELMSVARRRRGRATEYSLLYFYYQEDSSCTS